MAGFSVKKPLTIFIAVLAILVLGVVAYLKMTPDLLPNMDFPYVIVVTTDIGASPESVEADVTRPLEESMATLDRIKSVTSTSKNSVSMVVLQFEDGVNMDTVSVDIQQKLSSLAGQWADTVSTPYMLKINPSMLPVLVSAISYEGMDVYALSDFTEKTLEAKLTGISGVASVDISGAVTRQVHVILDAEKMAATTKTMTAAVESQLDAAKVQLNNVKKQLTQAQAALESGMAAAADGLADGLVGGLQKSADALSSATDVIQSPEAIALQAEIAALEGEIAANEGTIVTNQAIIIDENAAPEARQQAALDNAALRAENAEKQVQVLEKQQRLALLTAATATRTDLPIADELQKIQQTIQKLQKLLTDPKEIASLKADISDGVLSVMETILLLTETNIQLKDALSQIEEGFATLASQRTQLTEALNVSSILNISTVQQLLTAQNFSMPAGYIDDDAGVSYMVSVGDKVGSETELQELVLFDAGLAGVAPIRLKDVATVFTTDDGDEIYTKLNGDDGILANFTKQSTFATAEVSDNIRARFDELEDAYPGLHFTSMMDQGDYIQLIVSTILSSLLWGALFSVIVLFLFLRDWRPTVITLVSIPTSVIFAVVLMYFSGVTINMISLSGLAVAVGMLVDNSVVVIENIYRLRAKGATVIQAAVSGAGQVVGAVTASTLTTVCVFLPIVFVEGLTKQLFTDLALTMSYSLLASLLVALTLVPAMGCGMLRRDMVQKPGILEKIYPAYRRAVAWSLDHKAVVLLGASAALLLTMWGAISRGFTFMPEMDMNNVNVAVTMPEDCDRDTAERLADEVCRRIETVDGVETVGATMSSGGVMSMSLSSSESYDVTVYVTLPEGESGLAASREIQQRCEDMDCTVTTSNAMSSLTSFVSGSGVSLKVYGQDMEQLQEAADTIAKRMEQVSGVASVSNGLEEAAASLHVSIDRQKAMSHGMTVAQVYLKIVSALSNTASGSQMTLDDNTMDVVIENDADGRLTRETLLELEITPDTSLSSSLSGMSGSGAMLGMSGASGSSGSSGTSAASDAPKTDTADEGTFLLGDVATVERTVSLNTIARDEQRRYVNVTAAIAEGSNVTLVSSAVTAAVSGLALPQGITIAFDGENEQIMEAMKQLLGMLLLGVLLVYFIMVAQFQSLREPLIVMFTIPLAFTGGFIALLISGIELSVVSLIGFVMLVGIIVNNGIVLVDYINQQRMAGVERREAIIDSGVTRLRPILMTSLTTILGLIVMALGRNVGTSLMQPVALVCIGGLTYATLMTLFVVPCMYDIIARKTLRRVNEAELKVLDE